LRELIGRLKVPTYEEWLAEEQRVDAARVAEVKSHIEDARAAMGAPLKNPGQRGSANRG
jgi:hypothetical protein